MRLTILSLLFLLIPVSTSAAQAPKTVGQVFDPEYMNGLVMEIEAAIAEAQAEAGVISWNAAREIRRTASIEYASLEAIATEYDVVRHRMVALLNVWRRSLSEEAKTALHFGVTTVDIYDTVRILQIKQSIAILRNDMLSVEKELITLAKTHRDTPMIGRTLGQHALPITFGKKVSVWAAANRRNIERLNNVECRLNELGVLRGAVGTHLGLGLEGRQIEQNVSKTLGLGPTNPADWHGMRDVFGEYAAALSIMSRTYAGIGQDVFSLQMTDIGEVYETRPARAVSSSTMPHKRNPSRSEALIHYGRTIPAKSEILIDDIANAFERDNTSRPNRSLEDLTIETADMVKDLRILIRRLEVDESRMLKNLTATDGMILSQRLVFHLQEEIGKEFAEERVALAARKSMQANSSFKAALLADPIIGPLLAEPIDALLDPTTYIGLSAEQVDATAIWLMERSASPTCEKAPG